MIIQFRILYYDLEIKISGGEQGMKMGSVGNIV